MIRNAIEKDSKILSSLIVRGWKSAYRGIISDDFLDSMDEEDSINRWEEMINSQNEGSKIKVYEEDGKVLGVIKYGVPQDSMDGKFDAEIQILYVEPKLKGKGIGTKLFNTAKDYFLKNNMNNLIIWCLKGNQKAIRFYEKMGGKVALSRKSVAHKIEVDEVGIEYKLNDKIILVKPTIELEDEVLEYMQEHYDSGEIEVHASSLLDKMDSYIEWLKSLEKNSKKETVDKNWTVSTQFLGVRQSDKKIVGMVSIRHELTNDFLRNYAGHIGYGIRPKERRKGYVTQMLGLALDYCKNELKLEKVMLACNKENDGSRKTIVNAGGVLEKEYKTDNGEEIQIYWIKLNKNRRW